MAGRDDRRVRNDDSGVSLVELLAAVTLMGIAMVAILSALGVMITSSREHRQMANAQVVLASAAEKVKAADYVPCTNVAAATSYATTAASASRPTDWGATGGSVTVTGVEFWNGSGFDLLGAVPCAVDPGLERITIRVTSPDGGTSDTVAILKGGLVAGSGVGGSSVCQVRKPGIELKGNGDVKDIVTVSAGTAEWFKVHITPGSCPALLQPLALAIPGVGLTPLTLIPNQQSTDPTWEVKDLMMPPSTTTGWSPGSRLTAIVYDGAGAEAGRFLIEVA